MVRSQFITNHMNKKAKRLKFVNLILRIFLLPALFLATMYQLKRVFFAKKSVRNHSYFLLLVYYSSSLISILLNFVSVYIFILYL